MPKKSTPNAQPKRGRPSTGVPRAEAQKQATKARRKKLIEAEKAELKTFVETKTKEGLAKLKTAMQLNNVGEVIDELVRKEAVKRKLC